MDGSEILSDAQGTGVIYKIGTEHSLDVSDYYYGAWFDQNLDGRQDEIAYFNKSGINYTFLWNNSQPAERQQYPFADTVNLNITLDYPINNTKYNDYNGSIIITTNEDAVCTNSDLGNWSLTDSTNTVFRFDNGATFPTQNISLILNCNDTWDESVNYSLFFQIDISKPEILDYTPNNGTVFNDSFMYFDISGYDNYAIWQMNLTIKNLSNDV
ncbi:unnamed protein product, partial [marine sediment metagenome]